LGRFALVHADGTIEVRRVLDSGATEVQRTMRSPDRWSFAVRVHPGLFMLYRRDDGYGRIASVSADGQVNLDRRQDNNAGFLMGTGLDDGWVFYYMGDGFAGSMRLDEEGGHITDVGYNTSRGVNRGYDRIAHTGGRRLLLYASSSGKSMLVRLGDAGEMEVSARPQLPVGWTVIAATGRSFVVAVDSAGTAAVLRTTETLVDQVGTAQIGVGHFTSATPFARGTIVIDEASGSGRVIEIANDGAIGRITSFQTTPGSFVAPAD
jgi:hypothetical protein